VIHLAAILPSAFHSNPFAGVDVNLSGCFELMRQAVNARVKRFVFASSMSVYGSSFNPRLLTEDDPAVPDEPYGASKRVVELVGETLAKGQAIKFVSLRIARVIGPGIKKTSSPWRSEIFSPASGCNSIQIPFAPEAALSLVHVEDVAHMLVTLAMTSEVHSYIYNTPAEMWEARHLKEVIEEVRGVPVELGRDGTHGGPLCDGSRFAREFGFRLRGLRERLSGSQGHN
jgi:nucleoside-diphosphate-sugar epimerase